MAKAKKKTDQDLFEEQIRENATHYNVVLHIAQRLSKVYHSGDTLEAAIEFAETVYDKVDEYGKVRSAMVYAVNEDERFSLVGTTNRFKQEYKSTIQKET